MATQLIAANTTSAYSSSITLADGAAAEIFLSPSAGKATVPVGAMVYIEQDSASGVWGRVATVTAQQATILTGPGTFRIHRPAQTFAVGVHRG